MSWKKIIKVNEDLLDCPKCEGGKLRLVRHVGARGGTSRSRGKLKCEKCGYEVIT